MTSEGDAGDQRQAVADIASTLFGVRVEPEQGDNVYVTLESPAIRHVTSTYQVTAPGGGQAERILVPVAFCRECGQDYLVVNRIDDAGGRRYAARQDYDASGGNEVGGYLFISDDQPWPASVEQVLADAQVLEQNGRSEVQERTSGGRAGRADPACGAWAVHGSPERRAG